MSSHVSGHNKSSRRLKNYHKIKDDKKCSFCAPFSDWKQNAKNNNMYPKGHWPDTGTLVALMGFNGRSSSVSGGGLCLRWICFSRSWPLSIAAVGLQQSSQHHHHLHHITMVPTLLFTTNTGTFPDSSSVLWHCWLGHLTRTNPSPIWPIMCLVGR